jgi:hypothetical protein
MADAPGRSQQGAPDQPTAGGDVEPFDVLLPHAPTDDGEGARVLRARPGRIEAGEVRPAREGKPLLPGAELVRLERRTDSPALYDVKVDHAVPRAPTPMKGPAQVATPTYRTNWERTFGSN